MKHRLITVSGLPCSSFLVLLLIYIATVAFRLASFSEVSTQADELHWVARSNTVLKNLKHGEISNLSTHLTHPGLPPAFTMAAAQLLATRYNRFMAYGPNDVGFVGRLKASRLSNILLSSFLTPLLYFFLSKAINPWIGLGTAFLLVFDPHHSGLSRQAHIDSGLTLFVVLTILSYVAAVRKRSLPLKLFAGVSWGAAVLTKPTAVSLLPFFVVFKAIRNYCIPASGDRGERSLLAWSDVYAFLVGQFLLALLYTRMWHHDSDYRLRLAISSSVADAIYDFGMMLQAHWMILLSTLVFLAIALLYAVKKRHADSSSPALLVALVLLVAITVVPQVVENLVRFWTWVAGLSGEKHAAYGTVWSPPEFGYLSLYWSELPTAVLLGILLGLVFLFVDWRRKSFDDRETLSIVLAAIAVVILWTLPLSVSAKQTLRYVMPVIPAVYLFAVYGFYRLTLAASRSIAFEKSRYVAAALLVGFFLGYAKLSLAWAPDFGLYHNSVSGGLGGAIERGRGIALAGVDGALNFLHDESVRRKRKLNVVAFGDIEVLKFSYERSHQESRLKFRSPYGTYDADMLIVFPQFRSALAKSRFSHVAESDEVYAYRKAGVKLLEIYEIPIPSYDVASVMRIPAIFQLRRTGSILNFSNSRIQRPKNFEEGEGSFEAVQAIPGVNARGFLLFGEPLRFLSGAFRARFWLMIPPDVRLDPSLTPERYALRIELGRCQRVVVLKDLSSEGFLPFDVTCVFDREVNAPLRAYWFGNVPVAIHRMDVEKERGGEQADVRVD